MEFTKLMEKELEIQNMTREEKINHFGDELVKMNANYTENGALAYNTTGKNLLDLNFQIPQLRAMDDDMLLYKWNIVYEENPELALRWLFFLRDVRHGAGERQTFRRLLKIIFTNPMYKKLGSLLLSSMTNDTVEPLIPFYGRWDDLLSLLDYDCKDEVMRVIWLQLNRDLIRMEQHNSISLLAKWLPSINTSSRESRRLAKMIADWLDYTPKQYRQTLSKLRAYLDVVERKMSANQWDKIKYENVPSKANLIYSDAFMEHDSERRAIYLELVKNGVKKINSSVLYPHEILDKLLMYDEKNDNNLVYEEMWKALPNVVDPDCKILVVRDGSGSMMFAPKQYCPVKPVIIATALAIYFAERLHGEFHNKFITFSANPELVNFDNCDTLFSKWLHADNYNDYQNTNLESVFNLILNTAIANNLKQEDLPNNLLFISDMEFDAGVNDASNVKLLDSIAKRYRLAGYKLPRIIFWNVASRSNAIPMIKNDNGVVLISGYSINMIKMIMTGEIDPYKCLVNQLMDPRYDYAKEIIDNLDK